MMVGINHHQNLFGLFTKGFVPMSSGSSTAMSHTWNARPETERDIIAIRQVALEAARAMGENLVLVLGHPGYYPRFGFTRASTHGIRPSFDVPDEAMMALVFDDALPVRAAPSSIRRRPASDPYGSVRVRTGIEKV
jgi:hypothetical protein